MKKLEGVEDTLFIPLVARIYTSKRFPDFFYDAQALELEPIIPTKTIEENSGEYYMLASIVRYHRTDQIIRDFIKAHSGEVNVVFLGIGLETAISRIGSDAGVFYGIDTEKVIDNRKKIMGIQPNEILLAGDAFQPDWLDEMDLNRPTLFVANGLFQYFKEDKILALLKTLQSRCPGGEIIFDATNEKGLTYANKYVEKTGNDSARMYFFINDEEDFVHQIPGARLIHVYPFFDRILAQLKKHLQWKTKLFMNFADKLNRTKLVHIGFD